MIDLEFPLLLVVLLTIACHLAGAIISSVLAVMALGDFRILRRLGLNGARRAVAGGNLRAELTRLTAQVILGVNRLPFLMAEEARYRAIGDDVWLAVLLSALGNAAISVLLMWQAFDQLVIRNAVLGSDDDATTLSSSSQQEDTS